MMRGRKAMEVGSVLGPSGSVPFRRGGGLAAVPQARARSAAVYGEAPAGEGSGAGVVAEVDAGEGEASLGWSGEADSRRGRAGGDGVEAEALQAGDGRGQGRRLPPIQIHSGRGGETRWIEGGVGVTGDVS